MHRFNHIRRSWMWTVGVVCATFFAGAAMAQDGGLGSRLSIQATDQGSELRLDKSRVLRRSDALIHSPKFFEFAGSSAKVALWQELDIAGQEQAFFSSARDAGDFTEPRQLSYMVKLRQGEFEPGRTVSNVHPLLQAAEDSRLYIVQFETPPLVEMRSAVERFGDIRGFLPHHSYVMEMSPAEAAQVLALPFVRWAGAYHPDYRVDENVRRHLVSPHAADAAIRYRIMVFDSNAGQQFEVAELIERLGGTVEVLSDASFLLEATLNVEQLARVVELDQVAFVDLWSAPKVQMNIARSNTIGGADYVESAGGYTGTGVRGEVMDNGINPSHMDFVSRLLVRNGPAPLDNSPPHGTSAFGIVFGDGTGSASARGMLPDAVGVFSFFSFAGSRTQNMQALSQSPYFCVFQSNSWGFSDTTQYTTVSAEMDAIVFNQDILVLHSMGNTGTQSGVEHAWGKNIVGVGGVRHFNSSNPAAHVWGGSGSIGPASDGRIKPDLTHFYDSIRTTEVGGAYTNSFGGTSGACPIVAGHFGLFFEMWADGLFGNPVSGGTVFEERAHAATAKAMLINTANSYAFSGLSADLTRTHQGWGLPNVQNIYDRRDHFTVIDEGVVLEQFETAAFTRTINSAQPFNDELRATMVYTDRAGSPAASVQRINDLSLKVISPSGVIYWGNNGLLTGNLSVAGGSSNTIDTVENVFVDSPENGIWTFEVVGDEIVQDGHPETGAIDADFSLVVYGGSPCPLPAIMSQSSSLKTCLGEDVTLTASAVDFDDLQWFKDGAILPGEVDLSLDIEGFTASDYGDYELAATNVCGEIRTAEISITPFEAPAITQQPIPTIVSCIGNNAVFLVETSGDQPQFEWFKDSVPLSDGSGISGSSTAMLTVIDLTTNSVGQYQCQVSGPCGSTELSTATTLSVTGSTYTQQPVDVCTIDGGIAEFTAVAVPQNGEFQLLQWYKDDVALANGGNISGAFENTLTISPVDSDDDGLYKMRTVTFGANCILFSDEVQLATDGCCDSTGDMDNDGDFDLADMSAFAACFGVDVNTDPGCACANMDDSNSMIDLVDWDGLTIMLSGPQ